MSDLLSRIDEHYAKLALAQSKEPWRPRPSNLGGCLREMAHRLSGMEPYPNSPESLRTFELGTQRGEALEAIAKSWPFAQTQVEVEMGLGWTDEKAVPLQWLTMKGTLDLWLPAERTIVDFKTSGVFGFSMDYDGGYDLQLQAYRHGILGTLAAQPEARFVADAFGEDRLSWGMLRSPRLDDIRCVLIYESKDSDGRKGVRAGQLKEVEVPHTEELEERYQARLKAIRDMLLLKARGALDPTLVAGVYGTKNDWKCKEKDGVSLYCSIGKTRGKCAG